MNVLSHLVFNHIISISPQQLNSAGTRGDGEGEEGSPGSGRERKETLTNAFQRCLSGPFPLPSFVVLFTTVLFLPPYLGPHCKWTYLCWQLKSMDNALLCFSMHLTCTLPRIHLQCAAYQIIQNPNRGLHFVMILYISSRYATFNQGVLRSIRIFLKEHENSANAASTNCEGGNASQVVGKWQYQGEDLLTDLCPHCFALYSYISIQVYAVDMVITSNGQ